MGSSALGAPTSVANGTIALGAGILQFNGTSNASSDRVINLTSSGGTIDASGTGGATLTLSGGVTGSGLGVVLTGTGAGTETGVISTGAGTLTKNGTGAWILEGANTLTGATTVNQGSLALSGANGSIAGATPSAVTVNAGGQFILDNSTSNKVDRLTATDAVASAVTLNGGEFVFKGSNSTAASESLSGLTISTPERSTVTLNSGTGGSTQLTFASITRSAGSMVLFRGDNLGATAGANATNLFFTSATNLGLKGTAPGGGATQFNKEIVPFAIGDTSSTGSGVGFVTYNIAPGSNTANTTGIRPLEVGGTGTEYDSALTTNGENVALTNGGTTTLTANVTTNSLLLSGGSTLQIGNSNTSRTLTLQGGAIFSGTGSNSITSEPAGTGTYTIALSAGTEAVITSLNSLTISTALTGNTGLVTGGAGTITKNSVVAALTGGINITSGTLISGITNAFASQALSIGAPGTLNLNNFNNTFSSITLESGANNGSTLSIGTGTLTLGGNVTVNTNGLGATGATISGTGAGNLALGASRTFTIANGQAATQLTVSSIISGATYGITKAGAGLMALSGLNTYTGAVTIDAGTLSGNSIANAGTSSAFGTGAGTPAITIAGGTLQYTGSGGSSSRAIALTTGTGTIDASGSGALTLSGGITGTNLSLALTGTGAATESGAIGIGSGSLTKNGTNTWTLSGANTYTGGTIINNGTLSANTMYTGSGTSSLGTGAITLGSAGTPGTLSYTGANVTATPNIVLGGAGGGVIQSTANTLTLSGTINNAGNPLAFDANTGNITATNIISGAGSLTKTGASTLTLSNVANTYTGQTNIYAGTLSAAKMAAGGTNSSLGATAAATPILLGSTNAATLAYTGGTDTTNRLITINGSGGGTIQAVNAGTLTLNGTIDSATAGVGELTLQGTGGFNLGGIIGGNYALSSLTDSSALEINTSAIRTSVKLYRTHFLARCKRNNLHFQCGRCD